MNPTTSASASDQEWASAEGYFASSAWSSRIPLSGQPLARLPEREPSAGTSSVRYVETRCSFRANAIASSLVWTPSRVKYCGQYSCDEPLADAELYTP
jgi:hypothetical protein